MTTDPSGPKTIDEYIAGFPPDVQETLQRVRMTIRKAAPEAQETIKYKIPTFTLKGNLISFAAYKRHIGLYPAPTGSESFNKEKIMSVKLQVSQVIDRPVEKVFHFMVVEHVRNHPRWDADIELWLDADSPIGVGTVIHRRNKRSGTPIEGTMEVVEYESNRAFGTVIHDGPVEMRGRITFEPAGDNCTTVTTFVELPNMDESMDKSFLISRLEESGRIRKELIESEVK